MPFFGSEGEYISGSNGFRYTYRNLRMLTCQRSSTVNVSSIFSLLEIARNLRNLPEAKAKKGGFLSFPFFLGVDGWNLQAWSLNFHWFVGSLSIGCWGCGKKHAIRWNKNHVTHIYTLYFLLTTLIISLVVLCCVYQKYLSLHGHSETQNCILDLSFNASFGCRFIPRFHTQTAPCCADVCILPWDWTDPQKLWDLLSRICATGSWAAFSTDSSGKGLEDHFPIICSLPCAADDHFTAVKGV